MLLQLSPSRVGQCVELSAGCAWLPLRLEVLASKTAVLGISEQRALTQRQSCGPEVAPERPSMLRSASHCQHWKAVCAHLYVGCAWPGKLPPPPEWLHNSSCSQQSGPQEEVIGARPLPHRACRERAWCSVQQGGATTRAA